MRYVSIDIETTGVDRELCQILEIGAVVEDTNNPLPLEQLPTFRVLVHNEDLYWEDVAYAMHVENGLLADLSGPGLIHREVVGKLFAQFLASNGFPIVRDKVEAVAAGKNFPGFDRVFLEKLPGWKENIRLDNRVLDPTLFYVDFANDEKPPSMKECKRRAGVEEVDVSHRALDDALDVVRLLRKVYQK